MIMGYLSFLGYLKRIVLEPLDVIFVFVFVSVFVCRNMRDLKISGMKKNGIFIW